MLVYAWPEAVHEQMYGWLPLHYGCAYGCLDDVILFWIKCWPMSWHMRTENGSLPLHLALKRTMSLDAIQVVLA